MQNSRNDPLMLLFLVVAVGVIALAACTGDDDDGGISLSQSDATETPEGTVPLDTAGTLPIRNPGFAHAFAELRARIEAELDLSPLSDDANVDELVAMCDGGAVDGEEQFQACIGLLELLVAQETPELQRLIDLTAEHAANDFPDRQDEIDTAAGLDEDIEPTTAPSDETEPTETTSAGTVPIG